MKAGNTSQLAGASTTKASPPRSTAATCLRRDKDGPILGTPPPRTGKRFKSGERTQHESNEPELYAENTAMTSLVSHPVRCSVWGDSSYPGNCDGRLFKDLILRYGASRVADPMMGSGTTQDVINGLNRVCTANIQYWGGDLNQGFNLLTDKLPGKFDFIWLHPPYWSIIQYSKGDDRDLSSCESYPEFLGRLRACLVKCAGALAPGGRLAVLVGDVRRRGVYTPIVRDVLNMERELGELRSIIIKAQHNCKSDSKKYGTLEDAPIKHEYCVIFRRRANRRPAKTGLPEHTPETTQRREKMETEKKQQPLAQLRIGKLKATVWANSSVSSKAPWHNTQLCRLYFDDSHDEWHESTNFGRDDLLALAELARETYRWIAEHEGRVSIRAGQAEPEDATE
jgi:hypothetical protein